MNANFAFDTAIIKRKIHLVKKNIRNKDLNQNM